MDSIAKLTMRQVVLLYFRPRDKNGIPKRVSATWDDEVSGNSLFSQFMSIGLAIGRSKEDLLREWEIKNNGKSS